MSDRVTEALALLSGAKPVQTPPSGPSAESLRIPRQGSPSHAGGVVTVGRVTTPVARHVEPSPHSTPSGMRPLRPPQALPVPSGQAGAGPWRAGGDGRLLPPNSGLVKSYGGHKYISRKHVGRRWVYTYADSDTHHEVHVQPSADGNALITHFVARPGGVMVAQGATGDVVPNGDAHAFAVTKLTAAGGSTPPGGLGPSPVSEFMAHPMGSGKTGTPWPTKQLPPIRMEPSSAPDAVADGAAAHFSSEPTPAIQEYLTESKKLFAERPDFGNEYVRQTRRTYVQAAEAELGRRAAGSHPMGTGKTPVGAGLAHPMGTGKTGAGKTLPAMRMESPSAPEQGGKYAAVHSAIESANAHADKYNALMEAALKEHGAGRGPWVSVVGKEHFPPATKAALRATLRSHTAAQDHVLAEFKKVHPRTNLGRDAAAAPFRAKMKRAGYYGIGSDD